MDISRLSKLILGTNMEKISLKQLNNKERLQGSCLAITLKLQ